MNQIARHWQAIGLLADIPKNGARRVRLGELPVAIFRTADDRILAIEDRCPHRGGPLSDGIVHDGCVTCPLHNWVIDLETGSARGADEGSVRTVPVQIDGDAIYLCTAG